MNITKTVNDLRIDFLTLYVSLYILSKYCHSIDAEI